MEIIIREMYGPFQNEIDRAATLTIFDFFSYIICYGASQKITVNKVLDFLKFFLQIENDAVGRYRFK